jgi:hypothetical protein
MLPLNPPLQSPRRRRPWLFLLLCLLIGPLVYFGLSYFRGDSTEAQLKKDLARAMSEHEGKDVEIVALQHNSTIGPDHANGYSGTVKFRSTGQTAPFTVWLEHFFNASGERIMMHWTLDTAPTSQP